MKFLQAMGLRAKLILLFVVIKVFPLILLGWLAWTQSDNLAKQLTEQAKHLVDVADEHVQSVGNIAINDAVNALDARARDDIERLTTDTAMRVASFLYDRDNDIRLVAALDPTPENYHKFLQNRLQKRAIHGPWKLAENGTHWEPVNPLRKDQAAVVPGSEDNVKDFHYFAPTYFDFREEPLYLEVTFIGLDGEEKVKATTSKRVSSELKNVANRRNTFVRAENYFPKLKSLKPGEIYVSDVIGAYVGSKIIGPYTPAAAQKIGIPYEPENSAYAGMENPVGKRFQGLIRWAMPVMKNGQLQGWVTLALDHNHLMSFTDYIVPSSERYRDINDAADGNYAFIWDHKGRSIVHPRHHSITGFDPQTGDPVIPWLEDKVYDALKESGQDFKTFSQTALTFQDQKLSRKPAPELTKQGLVGLDCRYLNFAPQCTGWHNLTEHGGSGSFVILWSGLRKLTTAAAIPYYTGQYGKTKRGFGFVTIGAEVDDFHKAANESKLRLDAIVEKAKQQMDELGTQAERSVTEGMTTTAYSLVLSTALMIVAVIMIAVWMASYLSNRIRWLIDGFNRFRAGDRQFRFDAKGKDETNQLASAFDEMANVLDQNIARLEEEVVQRTQTENELREIRNNLERHIQERTKELSLTNEKLLDEIEIRRLAEAKAQHLAGHDPLTGLPNRLAFNQRLQYAIHEAARSGMYGALLFFDLDRFKVVNDTLGHRVGDALLMHVSQILQQRVRKTDIVARLGGDEFAVIMTQLQQPDGAATMADSIIKHITQPIHIGQHQIHVGTSIGIVIFNKNDEDPEQLLVHADIAMYQAKASGGNAYCFFEQSMQHAITEQKVMEAELRTAIAQQQFEIHYQPRHHCVTGYISGVEALVRWQHPTRGLLFPASFLETATRANLMNDIDHIVFKKSCEQAGIWLRQGISFGRIALNILPSELSSVTFVPKLLEILEINGLKNEHVEIEITERALLQDSKIAIDNLHTLRKMGVLISIDDFGIEHSSLQRLVEYPIDLIKIDRFFVSRIGDRKSEAVIESIIAMARAMGLDLIAEGVETEAQLEYLRKLNCYMIQGYLMAKPMPPQEITAHLKAHTPSPLSTDAEKDHEG